MVSAKLKALDCVLSRKTPNDAGDALGPVSRDDLVTESLTRRP